MRYLGATLLLASAMALPLQDAKAQDPLATIVGGAIGAGVGAAATGGRAAGAIAGGVIGATAAAAITWQPRPGGYYWYDNRCWYRYPNGEYRMVRRGYCG
jgi:hypothetical protein